MNEQTFSEQTTPRSLEERIAGLENQIENYTVHLNKAIDEGNQAREERFAGLIKIARENLLKLQELQLQREERERQYKSSK